VKPATLQSIFDVFIKTRDKVGSSQPTSSSQRTGPSADDKAKAEKFKQEGNAQMSNKNYDSAIESYTKAIALDSNNPVYYSNRAAAYSSKGDHLSAIGDAEQAISIDSNFVKAYHRLGLVFSLRDLISISYVLHAGMRNSALKTSKLQQIHSSEVSSLIQQMLV